MRLLKSLSLLTVLVAYAPAHAGSPTTSNPPATKTPAPISLELYRSGQHYYEAPVAQAVETGDKIEVREFFWYLCPHCYTLEPEVEAWLKKKPANVEFVRTPGLIERGPAHAQAYYALELMNAVDGAHRAVFDAIHRDQKRPNDKNAYADIVSKHGVDRKKFLDTWESFGVRVKLQRAIQLNQDLHVSGVPTIVVDGKYITTPQLAQSDRETMKVVDFLVQKAAIERKKRK